MKAIRTGPDRRALDPPQSIRETPRVVDLFASFMRAFERAIAAEMAAMREQLGPFEVEVAGGRETDGPPSRPDAGGRFSAVFDLLGPDEKLVAGTECTLRRPGRETLVTIAAVGRSDRGHPTVTLECVHALRSLDQPGTLVLYPWFLYEKLRSALASIREESGHRIESGLLAFGKRVPQRRPSPRRTSGDGLDPSQRAAVDLCAESDLAFVWGPPGTGKTHTLAAIVAELMAQGQRVLLTSTTNAAVDQALGAIAAGTDGQAAIERGEVVRIGRTQAATHGAGLADVVARRERGVRSQLGELRQRDDALRDRIAASDEWLEQIDASLDAAQGDLFGETPAPALSPHRIARVFRSDRAARFAALPANEQRRVVAARRDRLQRALAATKERASTLSGRLGRSEGPVVEQARLVLATMTNTYFSRLLEAERYDVVIIEEAGMATLPTLFYCATLARERVVLVGDPRQLPSIVQSRDPHAQRFMGRSIFDVSVPDPHASPVVAMLDTQYRMHPAIGDLVSRLYYDGRLTNAAGTGDRARLAAREPFPGEALVVVDTAGETSCATAKGSRSRFNEGSAHCCVEIVRRAVAAGTDSIAVITPYAEQSRRLRRALREAGLLRRGVECSTVHRFQGNERDLVVLDAVDAAPLRPGVLLASRDESARKLVNVSLSRARGKLILVADVDYIGAQAPGSAIDEALRAAIARGRRCARLA